MIKGVRYCFYLGWIFALLFFSSISRAKLPCRFYLNKGTNSNEVWVEDQVQIIYFPNKFHTNILVNNSTGPLVRARKTAKRTTRSALDELVRKNENLEIRFSIRVKKEELRQ